MENVKKKSVCVCDVYQYNSNDEIIVDEYNCKQ